MRLSRTWMGIAAVQSRSGLGNYGVPLSRGCHPGAIHGSGPLGPRMRNMVRDGRGRELVAADWSASAAGDARRCVAQNRGLMTWLHWSQDESRHRAR